eukprot:6190507-Pleurochrysis_carterae.AAC.3
MERALTAVAHVVGPLQKAARLLLAPIDHARSDLNIIRKALCLYIFQLSKREHHDGRRSMCCARAKRARINTFARRGLLGSCVAYCYFGAACNPIRLAGESRTERRERPVGRLSAGHHAVAPRGLVVSASTVTVPYN